MSIPTTPRGAHRIAFSTMISFWCGVNVRSIIRIRPARTCGYSRLPPPSARDAARDVWAGTHVRVLEARDVEPPDRGEDDVVEVALASAVSLHRVEAELERRDSLRPVRAADRAVHPHLDRGGARLDELRPVVDRVERIEVRD